MENVKFFVACPTNFVEDRHLWAIDNPKVEKYIRSKYDGDFEEFYEITKKQALEYLKGRVHYAPQPQLNPIDAVDPNPDTETLIKWMVLCSQREYDFMMSL